jgi:WD40 repeat protein
LVREQYGLTD